MFIFYLVEVSYKYIELEVRLGNVVFCVKVKFGNILLLKEGRREWMLEIRVEIIMR